MRTIWWSTLLIASAAGCAGSIQGEDTVGSSSTSSAGTSGGSKSSTGTTLTSSAGSDTTSSTGSSGGSSTTATGAASSGAGSSSGEGPTGTSGGSTVAGRSSAGSTAGGNTTGGTTTGGTTGGGITLAQACTDYIAGRSAVIICEGGPGYPLTQEECVSELAVCTAADAPIIDGLSLCLLNLPCDSDFLTYENEVIACFGQASNLSQACQDVNPDQPDAGETTTTGGTGG